MRIIRFISKPTFNNKSISYNAEVEYCYDGGRRETRYQTLKLDFYGDGMIFANEFLAVMNKKFGTDYPYDESYKNEAGKKHGNINIHKCFELRDSWGDTFELLHRYDYDNCKGCTSTYGDYSKSDLIAFADAVADYNKNGIVNKPTDFHPTYKLTDKLADAQKIYDDNVAEINRQIAEAEKALNDGLSGVVLENAVNMMKWGFRYSLISCKDKLHDAERNIYLDEMEIICNLLLPKIPIYQSFFKKEVVNNQRKEYYSSDDRFHSWCGIRINDKDDRDTYGFLSITPYENNGNIFFEIRGDVRKNTDVIKLCGLTYEEVLEVINIYNDMLKKTIWG